MNNISTQKWKDFLVKDIFVTEKKGKKIQVPTGAYVDKKQLKDGTTPRITVTGTSNGIFGYFDCNPKNKNYRLYENFISVSFLGTVFYQKNKVSLDMKVHCLKPQNMELNDYTGLYLVTAINKSLKNSSYADQISSTVLAELSIKLPSDEDGNPDFSYMEEYMKNREIEVNALLTKLQLAKCSAVCQNIDTTTWETFQISKIFPTIEKPFVYHTKHVIADENGIPYVVRSKYNNGIKYRVKKPNGSVNPARVISFGAENATFFYQKEEWVSGRDIYYIDTRHLDEYACLFITACLQPIAAKYSYNFGLFPDLLRKEKIKLPVNAYGTPDYDYMSAYISTIKTQSSNNLNLLLTV